MSAWSMCIRCGRQHPGIAGVCSSCRSEEMQAKEDARISEHNRSYEAQALLEESRKQTRLIEEQGISDDYAYRKGLEVENLESRVFNNDLQFYYHSPFLSQKLNEFFGLGVAKKIKDTNLNLDLESDQMSVASEKLISELKEHALLARAFVLEHREKTNDELIRIAKMNDAYFSNDIALWKFWSFSLSLPGLNINCGEFSADLMIDVDINSGLISFKNPNRFCITNNSRVNSIFDSTFDAHGLLAELNGSELKLNRAKQALSAKIADLKNALAEAEKINNESYFLIIRRIISIAMGLYGIYFLLTWSDNIFIAFFVGVFGLGIIYVLCALLYEAPKAIYFRKTSNIKNEISTLKRQLKSI
jgi:hypothetical protein